MKLLKYLTLITFCFLIYNCESEDSTITPEKVILNTPTDNSPCLTGASISATEIEVIFKWYSARYADSYDLKITNLISNEIILKSDLVSTEQIVVLQKGKPYSWSVSSKSNLSSEAVISEVYNFYVGGSESLTNPPIAATLIIPKSGSTVVLDANGKTTLSWDPGDSNNNYTLYLDKIDGKQPTSSNYSNLSVSSLDVKLDAGSTYYWRVQTSDEKNSSYSVVSSFKTSASFTSGEDGGEASDGLETGTIDEVPGNILKNGTFESGNISPWGGFKNAILSSSDQLPNTGNYLARIEPGDGSLYQLFHLESGQSYELKFYHRWNTVPFSSINVVIKDQLGDQSKFLEKEISANDSWTENKIDFTVPAGVTQARLLFYKSQTDPMLPSLFLDDLVVVKK